MASPSPILDPQTSTPIPTIPQMIETLSDLHKELSTALEKRSATPTQAAGDKIVPAVVEPPAPTQTPEEQQGKKETEQVPEFNGSNETHKDPKVEILLNNIQLLMEALKTMINNRDKKLNVPIQSIKANLDTVIKMVKEAPAGSPLTQKIGEEYLDAINKDMRTLKFQIPSYRRLSLAKTTAHFGDRGSNTRKPDEFFRLPNLYGVDVFDESPAFKEIQTFYNGFDDLLKKCFLYFAVFPENVVLKKRFLTYWWIGEDLLDASGTGDSSPENKAGMILQKFADKGLIVPVKEEQKKVKKKFRMPPLVRSAAIKLATAERFLKYDSGDNPTCESSSCDRIFLVKGGGFHPPEAPTKNQKLEEKMGTIFNVSQPFPDSALEWLAKQGVIDIRTTKVVEWLLKLRNLKVLYLGRWQSEVDDEEHVVEVESLEFLEGLKKMKKLRLLSLQGIFWINELPNSINRLCDLRVLDLKCCYNLEKLPGGIGSLKSLTHLDVTGCYMLNGMPKSISRLTQLRVLKGFITGKSSLNYLKGLKKLRKLSINTSSHDFPNDNDLRVLRDLGEHGELQNLAIVWVAQEVKSNQQPPETARGMFVQNFSKQFSKVTVPPNDETLELPKKLEKLELECLRVEELPNWLNPDNLKTLKKLYIRGGSLKKLGDKKWEAAEVVRLKYMTELQIDWRELQNSFPKLSYLQKVKCPRVTFCPCDANGVWIKP
ncbi:probable disease resistance protein RF45 [Benincasa hispida]|uniref:probable disease resistance protein RF45 n=1 Tax=Benincasa hispida TaxID=102211 RepID=UPI0019013104|nr:probable disease resistance protein RF45 [Benincasa hispida]